MSDMSGSGVAFTLVRALEENEWEGREADVALAAIGTVADVMPLLGENRTIVSLGLQAMNAGGEDPVFSLTDAIRKNGERLECAHIGFRIAPRINAAGRIADPNLALRALLAGGSHIEALDEINTERQAMTEEMVEISMTEMDFEKPLLAHASKEFHPGIIGLIAGKLARSHRRPCMIGCEKGGVITCSLRSIPGHSIMEALQRCSSHLLEFGGHAAAAGCSVSVANWPAFVSDLTDDTARMLTEEELTPTLEIDAELSPDDLTLDLLRDLRKLEPFGHGNPEPLFLLRNIALSSVRTVGKRKNHLQCHLGGEKAVGFGLGHLAEDLPETADIVCRLGMDSWNGKERVQIFVEDIATAMLEFAHDRAGNGASQRR